MKIALINAPYMAVYGPDRKSLDNNFPLGLGYVAAYLKKIGHEVFLFDPEAEGLVDEALLQRLKKIQPEVIGISSVTYSYDQASHYASLFKSHLNVPIVLGGHHASALPEVIIDTNPHIDFVVCGEGEITMAELCDALSRGHGFDHIEGLCFRNGSSTIRTPPRKQFLSFEGLPFPARELVDLNNYRTNNQVSVGKRSASMVTSRGCPNHCVFCGAHAVMGRRFRPYSPEYVVGEIKHLVEECGAEHVAIKDDTFTIGRARVEAICRMLIEQRIHVEWSCNASVNTVDYDLLKQMKAAGCRVILFGIESGNPVVMKNMKKGITPEQARSAVKAANQLGIKTLASFIFGLPGETPESIEDTIRFAIELSPVIAMFFVLVPLPGSEAFETMVKTDPHNIREWSKFAYTATDYVVDVPGYSHDDLRRLISKAYTRFYARPGQVVRILKNVRSFSEFLTYFKGGLGLAKRVLSLRKGN